MELEFHLVYKNLPTHHLERDELAHELTIRSIQFNHTENRASLRQKLRDGIKSEKEKNNTDFLRCNRRIDEEINAIDSNLYTFKNHLRSTQYNDGSLERYKSRLVHYYFRALRVQENADEEEDLLDLDQLIAIIRELMFTYFCPFFSLQSIREEAVRQMRLFMSEYQEDPSLVLADEFKSSPKQQETQTISFEPHSVIVPEDTVASFPEKLTISQENFSKCEKIQSKPQPMQQPIINYSQIESWHPYSFETYPGGWPQFSFHSKFSNREKGNRWNPFVSQTDIFPIHQAMTSSSSSQADDSSSTYDQPSTYPHQHTIIHNPVHDINLVVVLLARIDLFHKIKQTHTQQFPNHQFRLYYRS